MVRGQFADDALRALRFTPRKAARISSSEAVLVQKIQSKCACARPAFTVPAQQPLYVLGQDIDLQVDSYNFV